MLGAMDTIWPVWPGGRSQLCGWPVAGAGGPGHGVPGRDTADSAPVRARARPCVRALTRNRILFWCRAFPARWRAGVSIRYGAVTGSLAPYMPVVPDGPPEETKRLTTATNENRPSLAAYVYQYWWASWKEVRDGKQPKLSCLSHPSRTWQPERATQDHNYTCRVGVSHT